MKSITKELDVYVAHLRSGGTTELTRKQREIWLRANQANDLLREYLVEADVVPMLLALYRTKLKGYSTSSAKRDIARAQLYFGYKPAHEKEYMRGQLVERGKKMLMKCESNNDAKGWAAVAGVLAKISGLDRDQSQLPDPEDLRNPIPTEQTYEPLLLGAAPVENREQRIAEILAEKKAAGHNIVDLEQGTDYEVLSDG